MNKNAKTSMWVFLVIGVVALFAFGVIKLPTGSSGGTAPLPDGSCELAPSILNYTVDAVNPGTAVTPTSFPIRINGQYKGTTIPTSFAYGDTGEIILIAADYLDTKVSFGPLGCGVNTIQAKLYATDDSTVKVFNDVGDVVTDCISNCAVNQTASSTAINQEVKFVAGSDQSSGDLVCVFDASNTTEVSDIVLSGASYVTTPKLYVPQATGSLVKTYEVPALIDGDSKVYNLKITPESSQTLGTPQMSVNMTCYTKEWFVDIDGNFKYGIEDADGGTEYEDTFDYTWSID